MPDQEPWASAHDLKLLAIAGAGSCMAAILPRSLDGLVVRGLAALGFGDGPERRALVAETMRLLLGPGTDATRAAELARAHQRRKLEERWGERRALRRRGWNAEVEIAGREHLDAALARGKGVVLWGTSFCGAVAVKVGLSRAGVDLVHLSGPTHNLPMPPTRIGRRYISPARVRAESRYVGERVVMGEGGAMEYLRVLKRRLTENRCVWIYGENAPGRRPVAATLFGRERLYPTGAPSLAFSAGAPLLVVHVERLCRAGYRILIEEAFVGERSAGKRAWVESAVHHFSTRLESEIRRHPADWDWLAAARAGGDGGPLAGRSDANRDHEESPRTEP